MTDDANATEPGSPMVPGHFPTPTPQDHTSDIQPTQLTGRPRINKAGLIVTAELDEAISRCRRKVQRLAKDCRRGNRRYRDMDFDFLEDQDHCLHGYITDPNFKKHTPTEALRVTQIFEDPKFFIDGATASDIAQGHLGDCWFFSALAVVANAGLIEQICVERDEKVGIYGFIFWRDSGWVDVIIDDLLFVRVPRWTDLTDRERMLYKNDQDVYAKEARKGSKALYFGKSQGDNETWVPLIEKAYAKLHGDYTSLEGGYTNEGVEDLTGAVSTLMYTQDILDPDEFWSNELMSVHEDRAFACFIPVQLNTQTGMQTTNGLVMNHAYSVTKAVEFNGKRFLKVRNPWGRFEWNGRWSDGSKEWNGEWLEALSALDYKFDNDGEFIMEYSDFLKTWDAVEKCRFFDKEWSCSQLWLWANLGTYPRPTNFGDISFTFSLSKDTDAVIVLAKLDERYFYGVGSQYYFSLHCQVFKEGEDEPVAISMHNRLWERSVNLEVSLDAGNYVVQVRVERMSPNAVEEDAKPKDSEEKTPPLPQPSKRKVLQKQSEKLRSMSIAANFRPADYGQEMPIAPETFAGMDITKMELLMHGLYEEHRQKREAIFGPSKADQLPPATTSSDASAAKPAEGTTSSAAAILAPPSAEPEISAEGEGSSASAVEMTDAKKDEQAEKGGEVKGDDTTGEVKEGNEKAKDTDVAKGEQDDEKDAVSKEPKKKVHEGYHCDGCMGPIEGSRFNCLELICGGRFDLCEDCMKKNGHREGHRFVEIRDPADVALFAEQANPFEESICVGLRVYTNKECTAVIEGQMRHGDMIHNYLTMSKII